MAAVPFRGKGLLLCPLLYFWFVACTACAPAQEAHSVAEDGVVHARSTSLRQRCAAAGQRILQEVNRARGDGRRCGLRWYPAVGPVRWNASLAKAAVGHAIYMAAKGRISHVGAGGTTPRQRAGAAGYEGRLWGENVASGQESAAEVVESWLRSPGHCRNIMDRRFKEMGAGCAVGADGNGNRVLYWSLLMAAPLSE